MKPSVVLFCPGRGSYGREELGWVRRFAADGPLEPLLHHADEVRRAEGRPTISELDAAKTFKPGTHLDGRNAAELIWFATLAQSLRLREAYDVLGVAGNSLGWYTALAVSGALTLENGWRLITTMARLQEMARGGQILTTLVDPSWRLDPELVAATDRALNEVNGLGDDCYVARSIHLGGHVVLAGTTKGVQELLTRLPQIEVGERKFPFQLARHGPFHTALCSHVAAAARAELQDLPFDQPTEHLIDGRGSMHSPWSADPAELLDYTVGTQVCETFDFTASVRTAMRELQPDLLLCAGPGSTLRAPVGHVVLQEGWRGAATKDELFSSGLVITE